MSVHNPVRSPVRFRNGLTLGKIEVAPQYRPEGTSLPRWLAIGAGLAVATLGVLLVGFYRVPWGGSFNPSMAGPAASWVGDLLTALGILGLIYQLSQLRRSRVDETTREINSIYTHISTIPWDRGMVNDGKLVYVYVQNNGERKAMEVEIAALFRSGEFVPESWLIDKLDQFSLPPAMASPIRALLFHVPADQEALAFGTTGSPVISLSWTDPWSRRVTMTDNKPSAINPRVNSTDEAR